MTRRGLLLAFLAAPVATRFKPPVRNPCLEINTGHFHRPRGPHTHTYYFGSYPGKQIVLETGWSKPMTFNRTIVHDVRKIT